MKRAAIWGIAVSLAGAALLHADDRKKPAAAPPSAGRGAAAVPATTAGKASPSATAAAPRNAKQVGSLSLAYVPRDALVVAAIRPPALLKCPAFAPIGTMLTKRLELEKQIGFSLERVEQVVVAFMLVERPSLNMFKLPDGSLVSMGENGVKTQPEPVVAALHLADSKDAGSFVASILSDGEEQTYAGRTYTRGNNVCMFAEGRTVIVGEEEYLRRAIVAGRDGASKAKWTRTWHAAAGADLAALANIAAIRNSVALKAKELGIDGGLKITPASAAPLFDAATALLALNVSDRIIAKLQVAPADDAEPADIPRIRNALRVFMNLHQAALSPLRETFSSDGSDKGAALLASLDILDSALDSVTLETKDRIVEASLAVGLDDAAKAILAWASMIEEDENEGDGVVEEDGEGAPVPAPAPAPVPAPVPAAKAGDDAAPEPKVYFPSRLRRK